MDPDVQTDFIKGFLDDDLSDQESYNSEADELQKGSRTPKRRKLEDDGESNVDSDDESEVDLDHSSSSSISIAKPKDSTAPEDDEAGDAEDDNALPQPGAAAPGNAGEPTDGSKKKKMSKLEKEAARSALGAKKSGVVYLSRIPPFMKPQKLRSLLEPYGKIGRIYLTPEDPEARKARVRNGGNKKLSYTEGWAEFARKLDAKKACDLLNTRPIGGKKGSFYHDDIWNLVYLKGFKWHHLTEQMEAENKEHESRLRAEIEKTTRENEAFVRNIDKAKMLKNMDKKRKRAGIGEGDDEQGEMRKAAWANGLKKKKDLQLSTKQVISRIF